MSTKFTLVKLKVIYFWHQLANMAINGQHEHNHNQYQWTLITYIRIFDKYKRQIASQHGACYESHPLHILMKPRPLKPQTGLCKLK